MKKTKIPQLEDPRTSRLREESAPMSPVQTLSPPTGAADGLDA